MPTFMRQKATLSSSSSVSHLIKGMRSQNSVLSNKTEGCVHVTTDHHSEKASRSPTIPDLNSLFFSPSESPEQPNGFIANMNTNYFMNGEGDITYQKSIHSSTKLNDNCPTSGALRYALHVRFLCPFSRKCCKAVQRCQSDPFSVPKRNNGAVEGERHFYLYNDIRVVFPQRHSDADEGKVCDFFFFFFCAGTNRNSSIL
ncbi:uncharacterized protein LOC110030087 [Phalaenopsis equestris]|uniref:uncharacterized protein LOC110030087 n=1 Tax=Phalaenopsis equestris TaxID=78828 RepID=UPI0009E373AD|nr:uncharacterized protein LOC110030087 [Phalaenopsis equestris]